MWRYLLIITTFLFVVSCRPTTFTPKPAGYFRIDTPAAHKYQLFDDAGFPYTFEYPVYSKVEKNGDFLEMQADNPFWLNIIYPSFNGKIFLTYKTIGSYDQFMQMVIKSDSFSFFHHEKADFIHDEAYGNNNGVSIMLYTVGGNAASSYQFTATDSTRHFTRGALYFDVTPNADSLKPANDFILQDIKHMLATLKFR